MSGFDTTKRLNGVDVAPFVIEGLFGWLHAPKAGARRDLAVLICPALAYDALDSYHSLRVLADGIAEAGYPAMRFNYPGTGDSCDIADWKGVGEPREPWTVWLDSIRFAARKLREMTGVTTVALCGVRIGATLAALAAESIPEVAGIILLAPVLRGRSYLRQMQVEAAFQYKDAVTDPAGLDFHELILGAATVAGISNVDLREVKLHSGHRVVVFAHPSPVVAASVTAWRARGAAVESSAFDGFEPMLCHDTQGDKLPADPGPVIDWLDRQFPAAPLPPVGAAPPLADASLLLSSCREMPIRFGADNRLFGMLCSPLGRAIETAVVIVNTGRHPRHGVGRFGVAFSRELAAGGIASLRIDFAGLGDSQGYEHDANLRSDVFEDEREGDIKAAIDALAALGYRKFAVQGLCSGAYHAFHGGLADPRISVMLLVNLPLFIWQRGDTIAAAKQRTYTLAHYGLRLADQEMWRKLLRGESDLRGIVVGQIRRVYQRLSPAWRGRGPAGYADSRRFAKQSLGQLAERKVRSLFLFAPDNVGIYEMELHFGKRGAGLAAYAGVVVEIVPDLDQILTCQETRALAAATMIKFIGEG
jgi:dienelactone hydrolase